MTAIAIGDRVRVSAFHNAFYALRGVVTCADPCMVLLDVYPHGAPIAIAADNLTVERVGE